MPRKREKLPENEWTHALRVDDVPENGLSVNLDMPEDNKAAVIRRINVKDLKTLSASLLVMPQAGGIYNVSGTFKADIVQDCVVTGDPIETLIKESLEGWFIDEEASVASFAKARKDRDVSKGKSHAEVEILDESEDPEPAIAGQIDLGELVVQHLLLAINPYPHKEGAQYDYTDDDSASKDQTLSRKSPFEALKDWKEKR